MLYSGALEVQYMMLKELRFSTWTCDIGSRARLPHKFQNFMDKHNTQDRTGAYHGISLWVDSLLETTDDTQSAHIFHSYGAVQEGERSVVEHGEDLARTASLKDTLAQLK